MPARPHRASGCRAGQEQYRGISFRPGTPSKVPYMANQHRFDPLAGRRSAAEPEFDVLLAGQVFFDITFTGLDQMPSPGTEVWTDGMGSSPGGIANQAIAASRLGLRTTLAAAFSDDGYGQFNWDILQDQEHVDLSRSQVFRHWHSPVTVSLSVHRDRSMVTHGHRPPRTASELIGVPPTCRAAMVTVGDSLEEWAEAARAAGTRLYGDVGWDPHGTWTPQVLKTLDSFYAFLPNEVEAMAYTRTEDPWAALYTLAECVPVAVVTVGQQGAMAIDSLTGEEEWVPALPVTAYDPTGAGDCFGAAFVMADLAGFSLADRLSFANLCASLSVQEVGGSLAAPGWGDIADWWHRISSTRDGVRRQWVRRYAFLEHLVSDVPVEAVRRASATIARHSDA
jgi:sugar/nucleoside kinase (ribokinase family)